MAKLSTEAKVGIGLSLLAALGVGGFLIYKSMKNAKDDATLTAAQIAALSKLSPPAQAAALRQQNPNISDEKLLKALKELAKGLKGGSGSTGGAPSGSGSGSKPKPKPKPSGSGSKPKDGYEDGYDDEKDGYDEGYDSKDGSGYDSGYGGGYGGGYGSGDYGSSDYGGGDYGGGDYGGGYGGGVSDY